MTMKKYHWKLLKRKVAIDQETLKKLNFEHGEILEAIKAKDPEKARRAMKSHVENLREALF